LRATLAVRDRNRQHRALHAGEQHRWRTLDDDETRAPLELFGAVAYEARPVPGSGDELTQRRQHLAAIAHAEREGLGAREELGELLAQLGIEQDRFRPALAGAEHVAVREAAAHHEAAELRERGAA